MSTSRVSVHSPARVDHVTPGAPNRGKNCARSSGSGKSTGLDSSPIPSLEPKKLMTLMPWPLLPAAHHRRLQRRRPGADAGQAADVDGRHELLVAEQHPQQGRRRARVGGALDGDLPEERRQVEGVVLHEDAPGEQPRQEHPADAGHVDHREGVEQHVVGRDLRRLGRRDPDGQPVHVAARHSLGRALGARCPADRHGVVGLVAVARDVRLDRLAVRVGGRSRRPDPHADRHVDASPPPGRTR